MASNQSPTLAVCTKSYASEYSYVKTGTLSQFYYNSKWAFKEQKFHQNDLKLPLVEVIFLSHLNVSDICWLVLPLCR